MVIFFLTTTINARRRHDTPTAVGLFSLKPGKRDLEGSVTKDLDNEIIECDLRLRK